MTEILGVQVCVCLVYVLYRSFPVLYIPDRILMMASSCPGLNDW